MKKTLLALLFLGLIGTGTFYIYDHSSDDEGDQTIQNEDSTSTSTETATEATTIDLDEHSCNTQQIFTPPKDEGDLTGISLYVATSEDGVTFGDPELFLEGGGVPSVTAGSDGTLVAVFNWFTDYDENPECYNKVAIKTSKDNGKTWEGPYGLYVEDFPEDYQLPFDPTITTTEDGQYRLFFTTHVLGMEEPFVYGSAISEDGLHYTYEGVAFNSDEHDVVDGSEVRTDAGWFMIAPMAKQNGAALQAYSDDGAHFEEMENDRDQSIYWVGNMVNVEGEIRFYGSCGQKVSNGQGKLCYSSTTDGSHWEEAIKVNLPNGDPGITYTSEGVFVAIYAEPQDMPMPEDSTSDKR